MRQFPTFKQYVLIVRRRIQLNYPDADREGVEMTVKMQATEQEWLKYLAKLINAGRKVYVQVLDTLTPEQLYSLRKHYVDIGRLDWYIPARYRVKARRAT